MRVLLFSSSYAPRTGGLETVTRRLASELVSRGNEVVVATNRYPRSLRRHERIDGISVYRQLYPDVVTSFVKRESGNRLKELLLLPLAPLALARLAWLIRRVDPDVINIHYFSYPAAFALVVGRVQRRAVVLSFHGSDLSAVPYPANYRASLRLASRYADVFTVCSENLKLYFFQSIPDTLAGRVRVIWNGTDVGSEGTTSLESERPYILVASRLVEKKGVQVALHALATLSRRGNRVHLVIAGDGSQRSQLEQEARDLGIASHVSFLGSVPTETVRRLMRESMFVVVPSHWEAFGMVCVEAMAETRAVVATRAGGIPEIVIDGETGILVEPDCPEELADGIARLLDDPACAAEMGRRGNARVLHHFAWSQTVDGYMSAYECAIGTSKRDHRRDVEVSP